MLAKIHLSFYNSIKNGQKYITYLCTFYFMPLKETLLEITLKSSSGESALQ